MRKNKDTSVNEFGRFQFKTRLFYDSIAILLAWFVSYYLRFFVIVGGSEDSETLFSYLSVIALVSGILFLQSCHLYEARLTSRWNREIAGLFKVSVYEFLLFTVIYYFGFTNKVSRLHLVIYGAFVFVFLLADRFFVNRIFAKLIVSGKFRKNVLLVGNGSRLRDYYDAAMKAGESGRLRIRGVYLNDESVFNDIKAVKAQSLRDAVARTGADIVVISFADGYYAEEIAVVNEGRELLKEQVFLLPRVPKTYVGTKYSEFHNIATLEINSFNITTGKRFLKRAFDLISCTLAVIILSPLFIILAILVKLSSPGPVFYKQKRVTLDGKEFTMLKFRSMRTDMKETGGAHWTELDDPRITPVGKMLRKTSLDEIPQFFNVIQGSMSLIGPRPERPELEKRFIRTIPGYNMRHRMKAGISGWAQVNGLRGNTSLEKRIEYDLYYISKWSFMFDLKIVFLTFFKGFVNKNAY